MQRIATSTLMGVALATVMAGPVFAYHCPALVKECQATADVVAKREGSDKAAVGKAQKACDEAMKLHQEGKHKESMVKAGEAIADASKALK
jgi:hypothetical protein